MYHICFNKTALWYAGINVSKQTEYVLTNTLLIINLIDINKVYQHFLSKQVT